MYNGYVQQLGTAKDIYNDPANVFVATFMGSPAMNVIPARVKTSGNSIAVEIANGEGQAQALEISNSALKDWDGKELLLGIRPEAIGDADSAGRGAELVSQFTNMVDVTEPAGSDLFVTMQVSGKSVTARMHGDADVHEGKPFEFSINMDKAVAFDPNTEARIGYRT